jgi:imidazolonepropionase-like amidohydrolase
MESKTPKKECTLVLESDTIVQVLEGYVKAPEWASYSDLRKFTVMPGLIDCHVHLEWEWDRNTYSEKYTLNEADIAFRSQRYAEKTLLSGFTTVRDLGGTGVTISLRNAIRAGLVTGPRIIAAGKALSITGGHADPSNGAHWHLFDPPGIEVGVADGPDNCRQAVRMQVKRGADCIKVCATGGVLSLARDGRLPHYAQDELEAIVQTARDLGVDVAAHAHGDEGIRRAILAGVRSIEHGTFMEDATMDLMREKGTWYVPTLTAGWAVSDSAQYADGFYPEMVRVKALGIGPKIQSTLRQAYNKKVSIAFGTDAGVFPHGKNALEFGFMKAAGMDSYDILYSATTGAATMLGFQDEIGSIAPGKQADLVAIPGDPMQNMELMMDVQWVMKGGVIVKKPD